jgi:hypothetical protein
VRLSLIAFDSHIKYSSHALLSRLKETLINICTADRDSTTRRSAGYPRIILAILSSAPKHEAQRLVDSVAEALLHLAGAVGGEPSTVTPTSVGEDMHFLGPDDNSMVANVHARNVLSTLVRDVTTGPLLTAHVPRIYHLAVTGFASRNYGLRNASMLLFAALQCRVVGSKMVRDEESAQNLLSARKFFALYPGIRDEMLERLPILLSEEAESNPELFLHLSALNWLRASPMEASRNSKGSTLALRPLLRGAAGSSDWKIRKIAARACVSIEAPNCLNDQLLDVKHQLAKGMCR